MYAHSTLQLRSTLHVSCHTQPSQIPIMYFYGNVCYAQCTHRRDVPYTRALSYEYTVRVRTYMSM